MVRRHSPGPVQGKKTRLSSENVQDTHGFFGLYEARARYSHAVINCP